MFWNNQDESLQTPISQCSMPCDIGFKKQLIKAVQLVTPSAHGVSLQDEVCCWACGKCEDYEYLANETSCVDCGVGRWPTADRKGCYDLADRQLKHMRWSSWYAIVPCIFAIVGIVATMLVIAVYIM